jgi:hypothetical protein
MSNIRKEMSKIDGISTTALIEYNGFNLIKELCIDTFIIKRTRECCLADTLVKPIGNEDDVWLPMQLKVTQKLGDRAKQYKFYVEQKYKNMMILLICVDEKKIWLIDGNNEIETQTISIGQHKSIYDKYQITDLPKELTKWYTINDYNITFDKGNTPITPESQLEYEYVKHRESKINFIEFTNSEIDGLVYDFKIGDLKIQEKVCQYIKDKQNWTVSIHKNNNKDIKKPYEKGDNDYYWFHINDKKKFYVVPESILIEKGYITVGKTRGKKSINISTNYMWLIDYCFDYDTINEPKNKKELLALLNL